MSTVNQMLFGDRSDVPDLLRALADYPFSFPAFDDSEIGHPATCIHLWYTRGKMIFFGLHKGNSRGQ
ncbi:unnamed protein product [Menidia menidia]|uniref:(Atlantic silverside) hypothetical protein n=1 Tax=Menidia menidia TaxID=238744 RepID=A0A8S4ASV5_9TELE|nr:unnamed protein product [Menidia menidia]